MSGDVNNVTEKSTSGDLKIAFTIAAWIILLPVLALQIIHREKDRSTNNIDTKRTNRLMIAVTVTNTLHQISKAIMYFHCGLLHCKMIKCFWGISRMCVKCINWLFLIHRAKMAQGLQPLLSRKTFEKILPTVILTFLLVFVAFVIKGQVQQDFYCEGYQGWNHIHSCTPQDKGMSNGPIGIAVLGLDILITIFLMTLFIVPLYRVYRTNLGVMNANQLKQRGKLRELLIWSVILTFINQITSTFIIVRTLSASEIATVLFSIGAMDPGINIWTSWLMISKNRRIIKEVCSCGERLQTQSTYRADDSSKRLQLSTLSSIENPSKTVSSLNQISLAMVRAKT